MKEKTKGQGHHKSLLTRFIDIAILITFLAITILIFEF